MKRSILFRVLSILAALAWMVLIFGFSSQSGEESGGLSGLIAKPFTALIAALQGAEASDALYRQVDAAVRTAAHFAEYTILGGLLLLALQWFGLNWVWLTCILGTGYALLDEWHQAFTPGRVCDLKDVLIDACGVLCGALLIKLWRKKHVYH